MRNESDEAYTENVIGRREGVPSLSDSASLEKAVGDGFNVPEAETEEMFVVSLPRGCRGPRAWHVTREVPRTWESLPSPPCRGRVVQPKEGDSKGGKAVRSSHSTLRR